MADTKTSTTLDERDGFLFLGNNLVLDFLNTCPVLNGEPAELLPDFAAILRWFRAAGLLTASQATDLAQRWNGSTRSRALTSAIRHIRETLRTEILAWTDTGKLHRAVTEELNQLLTDHPMLTRVKRDTNGVVTESWFKASEPEDLFAPLAHSAVMLFASDHRSRVRKCANCVLHFYDDSKKGTRRWCSMQLCGNRSKVAAYAARQRSSK